MEKNNGKKSVETKTKKHETYKEYEERVFPRCKPIHWGIN